MCIKQKGEGNHSHKGKAGICYWPKEKLHLNGVLAYPGRT
jgi:hypothetical protein